MLGLKQIIPDLPVSAKQADCTLLRFYLYLLPVVNLALVQNEKATKDIFIEFVNLLTASSAAINHKITSLLHMFNAMHKGLKAYVF